MATQEEYRRGAERLLDFIAAEYDEKGASLSAPDNAQFYYKLPATFAYGGRRGFASRALQQFVQRFLKDDHLNLDPDTAQWRAYVAGWAAWGGGVLGRFDLSKRIISPIFDSQNAQYGGFVSEIDERLLQDTVRSSGAAMGCIWSMALEKALNVAKFAEYAIDNQPEPGVFYTYFTTEGNAVPESNNRMAYFSIEDQHAFPAILATTVASLVWLGRITGDSKHYDTAFGYMKHVFSSRFDPAKMPLATKLGWASLMLSKHIKDDVLVDFARRDGDDILRRQNENGSINFDAAPDFEKPLAKVWHIGFGCDAALTLLSLGYGVN